MGDGRDLMRRIASAAGRADPRLSDEDVERLVAEAHHRRGRRATARRTALAVGAAASLAFAGVLALHHARRPVVASAPRPAPAAEADRTLRLSDGSTAVPLDPQTEIALVEERPERVGLSLARGRAQFQVTPRPNRAFVVRAGDVTVSVVGTVFTVERVADRVGVAVQRGVVRVDWGAGSAQVAAGQSGWYPPLLAAPFAATAPERPPPAERAPHPSRGTKPKAAALAGHDEGEAAAALLLDADRARLAGRTQDGAELLRKLLREYPGDPRAPLAAFTLGRLLLMELGQPAEAAAAFAQARRLSPNGPFAEDALAREVEALGTAGLAAEAHARAEEYQRLYPNGRRMPTVRTAGGTK